MSEGQEKIRRMFKEAAEPAWAKVPQEAKALLERVNVEAFDIATSFGKTPWPESSLKDGFRSTDPGLLAGAAFILSRYAIWNPDRSICEKGNGGWYKFISYVEQTLNVRHGLPEGGLEYDDQWGMGLSVCDGLARIEFDVREKWGLYSYIGLATDKVVAAIRSAVWPRFPGRDEHPMEREQWVQRCLRSASKLQEAWRPPRGAVAMLFDCGAVEGHPEKANITPQEVK